MTSYLVSNRVINKNGITNSIGKSLNKVINELRYLSNWSKTISYKS